MNCVVIGYLLALVCVVESTIKYHERSITTISPPSELKNDAYFGYSLAFEIATKRLIISAPTADNTGHIYSMHLENKNVNRISIALQRENPNVDHNYWLGASISAGPDYFVTCAPRYIENIYARNLKTEVPTTNGKCLKVTSGADIQPLPPPPIEKNRFYDAFGWSVHAAYENLTFIGGLAQNTGQVLRYHNLNSTPAVIDEFNDGEFNFGYTVTSTNTLYDTDNWYFLIANTYGDKGVGKVRLYNKENKNTYNIFNFENTGSMFGSALCTLNLGGARPHFLLGNPTHSEDANGYDRGVVYILHYDPNDNLERFTGVRTIPGIIDGAHFGRTMVNLGDIDGDKLEDVAIASPFEDQGRGAVYIYTGKGLLNFDTWVQRIQPEGFRAFGLSMMPVHNYENNYCTDLAIGAPYNNRVAFVRCISCATVQLDAQFPTFQEPTINTYFEIVLCINVVYPELLRDINENITMKLEMIHSAAKMVQANQDGIFVHNIDLKERKEQYCQEIGVVTPTLGNYEEAIQYAISVTLDKDPATEEVFDSTRLMFCEKSVTSLKGSLRASDCGADAGFCSPNLRFHSFTSDINSKPYLIGSSDTEKFEISVLNEGETAYQACMRVWVLGANVLHPGRCSYEDGHFLCVPPHSLHKSDLWDTGLMKLEMFSLTSRDQNITIRVDMFNRCDNVSSQTVTEVIYLDPDMNGILIKGRENPDSTVQIYPATVLSEKPFDHIYTIINNGSTNWVDIRSIITIKKNETVLFSNKSVTIIKDKIATECNLGDVEDKNELQAVCFIGELKRNRKVTVIVPLDIQSLKIDKDENITISSKLDVILINETRKTLSLNTTVMYQTSQSIPVPLWITISSSISGVILLLLIIFALYKVGFLQRKNKYKLDRLKKRLLTNDPINVLSWMSTEDLHNLVEDPDQVSQDQVPTSPT